MGLHSTRAIPGRQAEALQRRCLAGREALLGANHPDTLQSMNNLAVLLEMQGKLAEAGLMVFGVGGDLPGRFTKGICHPYRSAIMIIRTCPFDTNHLKSLQILLYYMIMHSYAHYLECPSSTKDVCKEQMPRCKFQPEMPEAVRAF